MSANTLASYTTVSNSIKGKHLQIENSLFAENNHWLAAAPHCINDILNLIWFLGYINLFALRGKD